MSKKFIYKFVATHQETLEYFQYFPGDAKQEMARKVLHHLFETVWAAVPVSMHIDIDYVWEEVPSAWAGNDIPDHQLTMTAFIYVENQVEAWGEPWSIPKRKRHA